MNHDHYITGFELAQLLAVFAAPFLFAGTFMQYRLWERRRTRVRPGVVAGVATLGAAAVTAAIHYVASASISDAWGFPAWVIAPPMGATIFVTLVVWLLASRLPNEEL